jgi:hypothetical protein
VGHATLLTGKLSNPRSSHNLVGRLISMMASY